MMAMTTHPPTHRLDNQSINQSINQATPSFPNSVSRHRLQGPVLRSTRTNLPPYEISPTKLDFFLTMHPRPHDLLCWVLGSGWLRDSARSQKYHCGGGRMSCIFEGGGRGRGIQLWDFGVGMWLGVEIFMLSSINRTSHVRCTSSKIKDFEIYHTPACDLVT